MPRTPRPSDFPSHISEAVLINPPSTPSSTPRSLLILLHGLGDTNIPFHSLGRSLNLPGTATLSLRGPAPLPSIFLQDEMSFDGGGPKGFHWGDDVLLDQDSGGVDSDAGFTKASEQIMEVLEVVLKGEKEGGAGFESRDVYFLGLGQGGMVALGVVEGARVEFGGVISVGGRAPASCTPFRERLASIPAVSSSPSSSLSSLSSSSKAQTPILLCGGSMATAITQSAVTTARDRFQSVEYVKWARPGDGMPGNREEMLPVMRFLARRLRMAAPEGMVEVGKR
jgi:predicted esterase